MSTRRPLEILDEMITSGAQRGVLHRVDQSDRQDGRTVQIDGKRLIHFGACSYLGLEVDPRLKRAAADAALRFGTHFPCSRAYLSSGLYSQLEALLERMFESPVVVAPTTTLAHLAALPVLCEPDDALLLDHQAHNSLRMAANQARALGARIETVRHGRLDLLEERIDELRKHCRRVWYVGDGVYSMYGDLAPVDQLVALANRWEQLHLYLDDAHGIGWRGSHGRGYVLECGPLHERMVVATTLAKGFGAGGGSVLVFPNGEWRRKVRTCGGPMIFSGPVGAPILGAAIASARIHLSEEIGRLQQQLRDRIRFANQQLLAHDLPLVSTSEVPIRFVGASLPGVAQDLARRLIDRGFFPNTAFFPAVGMKRAGLRFTITRHQSFDDIRAFVEATAEELPRALAAHDSSLAEVREAFSLGPPAAATRVPLRTGISGEPAPSQPGRAPSPELHLQVERSIEEIPAALWDGCLGARGSFSWNGMRLLESVFSEDADAANQWKFHYYVVRDRGGNPLLATFFTESLWKDDMLAAADVSSLAEQRRLTDPGFLTSRVFSMGCLLTEGDHLFLDRRADWRAALRLLLREVDERASACGANSVALRDVPEPDPELEELLSSRGFLKVPMPESLLLEVDWEGDEEFLARLSPKARRHQRHEVLRWEAAYSVEVLARGSRVPSGDELAHFYSLYKNVKRRNLSLNTFDLPAAFFERALDHPDWELVLLSLRPEFGGGEQPLPDAVGACFVGPEQYVPMVIGLDYRYVRSHGLYRQCLLQTLRRARHHGLRRILLGMGAPLEKRRFGARPQRNSVFLRTEDTYQLDLLAGLTAELRAAAA